MRGDNLGGQMEDQVSGGAVCDGDEGRAGRCDAV